VQQVINNFTEFDILNDLKAVAKHYDAWEAIDINDFQRKARLLQSIWRTEQGYPIGFQGDRQLGSRLAMPWAKDTLANYLTDNIRSIVRNEIENEGPRYKKLYGQPRIYSDLLSSQPLCFNLFAELKYDFGLATKVFNTLTTGRVNVVTGIEFEYSPGRRDQRYTGDRTAFDVYVTYETSSVKRGFIGIEVKYHENMKEPALQHYSRYDEIARTMSCFKDDAVNQLKQKPLQQVWRDHLLAGSILILDDFDEGSFAFIYPKDNKNCRSLISEYQDCLCRSDTFKEWTLELVADAIKKNTEDGWIDMFTDRYLNFSKLERYLKAL
jgi:hypothetical protein